MMSPAGAPARELRDQIEELKTARDEWREETKRLESRFTNVQKELGDFRDRTPQNSARGPPSARGLPPPQRGPPGETAKASTLNHSLQILTCLKDVLLPQRKLVLPDDPQKMTREQFVVYHFLNEIEACNAEKKAPTTGAEAKMPERGTAERPTLRLTSEKANFALR
jgi:hypothetical protein